MKDPPRETSRILEEEKEQDVERSLSGNETAGKHQEEEVKGCCVFVAHTWLYQIL